MKIAFFALLFIASAFAGDYQLEDGVYVLTDENFGQALNEFDYALVEFYAPWCGHCKNLAPNYAAAAKKLADSNPEIKLCKVDATVHKNIASKQQIRGYPTIKFFAKGRTEPIAYEAGRSTEEIIKWVIKKTGPASTEVKSVAEAEKIIADNDVVGFFFGEAGSAAQTAFLAAAVTFDDVAFAHTNEDAVRQKLNVQGGETLVLFKKFDEGRNDFSGAWHQNVIRDFMNKNRYPIVMNYDAKTSSRIFGEKLSTIFLVKSNDAAGNKAEEVFRSVADEIKGKITLAIAKLEDPVASKIGERLGVSKTNAPALRILKPANNQKYRYDGEITAESIKSFVDDFIKVKLSPFLNSEPIPTEPHQNHVRVVVGNNWKDIVQDSNNDVLIEYYAPWCGHCKKLMPIFEGLGKRLKDVPGIVIAKMDATANEIEGLGISSYPTIKFYPKWNKKKPIDFKGDRTEKGFIDFLKENSSADIAAKTRVQTDEL